MIKRAFKTSILKEMTRGDHDDEYEIISNEIYDTSRWSNHYELIFKFEDKFYQTSYSVGATEQQDESPFEYDGPEVECIEVAPYEVTTVKYKPV